MIQGDIGFPQKIYGVNYIRGSEIVVWEWIKSTVATR